MKKTALLLTALLAAACSTEQTPDSSLRLHRDYTIDNLPVCRLVTTRDGFGRMLDQREVCEPNFVCTLIATGQRIPCPRQSEQRVRTDTESAMSSLDAEECRLYERQNREHPNRPPQFPGRHNKLCGR